MFTLAGPGQVVNRAGTCSQRACQAQVAWGEAYVGTREGVEKL